MSDHVFNKFVAEYFEKPGAEDYGIPTGKDGEPLTPKGREIAKIKSEEKEWYRYHIEKSKIKLQDNLTWVLDHQTEDTRKDEAYHTLVEVVKNCAEYHNETGKKAERLLELLQDPTLLDK